MKKISSRLAVKQLVDAERKLLPRLGTRKIYHLIAPSLKLMGLKCGRDKLFKLMGYYDLQIKPKRRYIQTTNSKHWMRKWPNIIKGEQAVEPDQIWVSDITYIKTEEGTCYLNMTTDKFSRKIVGYAVEDNMETESMIPALRMANDKKGNKQKVTIHHSDRGVQYCSKEYINLAKASNIKLSMTENGDPYENALAERMNRTIKEEFGLDRVMKSKAQVRQMIPECIFLYNTRRPHLALEMQTPEEVYNQKVPAT